MPSKRSREADEVTEAVERVLRSAEAPERVRALRELTVSVCTLCVYAGPGFLASPSAQRGRAAQALVDPCDESYEAQRAAVDVVDALAQVGRPRAPGAAATAAAGGRLPGGAQRT
jgi:hypothetical protein